LIRGTNREIGGRIEFFPRGEFFPTVQTKTGLTGFLNRSARFSPVGCREEFLSKDKMPGAIITEWSRWEPPFVTVRNTNRD
jgi:hypothetical protein